MIAVGTWIAGHVDRLSLSPPHIAPQATVQLDVREYHIGNGSLVAILDAQSTVRTCDDAVIKHHVIDRVHILATNLDGARAARHHTVGNSNIVARAILLELTTVLQTDAVITTGDMAVSNTHMLRMVDIDTIAIADFQVVQQINAINHSFIATNQMNSPVSALFDGDIADGEILHISQREHMWARVEGLILQRLQLVAVAQLGSHKGDAIAMNGALTADADILGMLGPKPQHTFASILTKGAQVVNTFIGVCLQGGSSFQIKLNITLELDGTSHEGMITWQQHTTATLSRTAVDSTLNGLGIVCDTITYSSCCRHIVNRLCRC